MPMIVLGIESSCDETSAAVVRDGNTLLSVVTNSSMDLHAQYGGVIPEIAARSHIECINGVILQAMTEAGCTWDDIDAIAVTYGAGLGGSLLIGVLTARTLAIVHRKPLYAINHVEGHVYANFLTTLETRDKRQETRVGTLRAHSASASGGVRAETSASDVSPEGEQASLQSTEVSVNSRIADYQLPSKQPEFPMLALIVSGGHSQLALFQDHFDYKLLGQTQDDAIGEAFDKVAKIIGLPYPGGPSVEQKAKDGNPFAYDFPKAKMPGRYDFSFSGVKTAVLRAAQSAIGEDHSFPSKDIPARLSEAQKADIAASFQRTAVETVVDKTLLAYEEFQPKSVVIAGGVASSPALREMLASRLPCPIAYTDRRLCTDNAAMIATLGYFHMKLQKPQADPYTLEIAPNLSM